MRELDDYEASAGYGDTIGKCLTFAEIEALLAAERERCAALAEEVHLYRPYASARQSGISIAAAIRALTPKAGGGEP